MSSKEVEIRIFPTYLMDRIGLLGDAHFSKPNLKPYEFEERVKKYRKAWKKKEKTILPAMQEMLDLCFYTNTIDVTITPWQSYISMSSPLIIDCTSQPDEFVDLLTHELFHVLFTDNQIINRGDDGSGRLKWDELFGETENWTLIIHIALNACLKYIYLDILKEPKRLKRDMEHSKIFEDYRLAWEYVEANDYTQIIDKVRQSYDYLRHEKN